MSAGEIATQAALNVSVATAARPYHPRNPAPCWQVPCISCGAAIDSPCVTAAGKLLRPGSSHQPRWADWRTAHRTGELRRSWITLTVGRTQR